MRARRYRYYHLHCQQCDPSLRWMSSQQTPNGKATGQFRNRPAETRSATMIAPYACACPSPPLPPPPNLPTSYALRKHTLRERRSERFADSMHARRSSFTAKANTSQSPVPLATARLSGDTTAAAVVSAAASAAASAAVADGGARGGGCARDSRSDNPPSCVETENSKNK